MRRMTLGIVVLFFLCFFFESRVAFAQSLISDETAAYASPFPSAENSNLGRKAPDFTLPTLLEKNETLENMREGKMAILFFWATWCPHCRETLKSLQEKKEEFVQNNVRLILINIGEKKKIVQKFFKNNKIEMDTFLDQQSSLLMNYGIEGVPAVFLINRQGIVNYFTYNDVPQDYLLVTSYTYPKH